MGVLKTTSGPDQIAVYQILGAETSRSLPDWIERRRKRSLKQDEGMYKKRCKIK